MVAWFGMETKAILKLVVALALTHGAGLLGSVATISEIATWYTTITRPDIAPPNWVFAPVWFVLYTLMGIALFLVWRKGLSHRRVRIAFWFFIAHLLVNAAWSYVFFGLHNVTLALGVIAVLWLMIAMLIVWFKRIDKRAGWLLVPYFLWVSFATYLNYLFMTLN